MAFVALLIGVLVASVLSFAVMGVGRHRRVVALARLAHRLGMRFSPGDPFDIPHRYAAFDLIRSGHSPHANNVTYGRVEGWPFRAFDFRYELGHGTRRLTRLYGVVVAETDLSLPSVLMWHEQDVQGGPVAAQQCRDHQGCWVYEGDHGLAERLAEFCLPLADDRVSMQVCGSLLLLCLPSRSWRSDYTKGLEKVGRVLLGLQEAFASPA